MSVLCASALHLHLNYVICYFKFWDEMRSSSSDLTADTDRHQIEGWHGLKGKMSMAAWLLREAAQTVKHRIGPNTEAARPGQRGLTAHTWQVIWSHGLVVARLAACQTVGLSCVLSAQPRLNSAPASRETPATTPGRARLDSQLGRGPGPGNINFTRTSPVTSQT